VVANGYAVRTFLRFDSLSTLDSSATVNRALLTLHPDSSAGFRDGVSFNLYAYPLSGPFTDAAGAVFDSTSISLGTPGEGGTEINCTALVQEWIAGLRPNNGFLITGTLESVDPWLRLFYSSQADSSFRPSLEIFYSLPPRSGF
ncbi:DNRLRE domain-containing protein, partial [bacterium]|nr:DNRLRE domain-containing protein [bacterium]